MPDVDNIAPKSQCNVEFKAVYFCIEFMPSEVVSILLLDLKIYNYYYTLAVLIIFPPVSNTVMVWLNQVQF